MAMRSPHDPYAGQTPLVDQMLGTAYPQVKKVADYLNEIRYVAHNMEAIFKVAEPFDLDVAANTVANRDAALAAAQEALVAAEEAATSAALALQNAQETGADAEVVAANLALANSAAAQAQLRVNEAMAQVGQAQSLANQAAQSVVAAQAAAEIAATSANIFSDVTAGLAAVVDGGQFQVVEGDELVRYRRDGALVATEVGRTLTSLGVKEIIGTESDRINGAQRVVNVSPPFSVSDWVGPVSGTTVIYGSDLRDENRFQGKFIQAHSSESMGIIPDYLGFGWRHYDLNRLGQVVRYVSSEGVEFVFRGNSYVPTGTLSGLQSVDANEVVESISQSNAFSASQFTPFIDYFGYGWRNYQLTKSNQVIGYTDENGFEWQWNVNNNTYQKVTGGLSSIPNMVKEFPSSALMEDAIAKKARALLREQGLFTLPTLSPIAQPAGTSIGVPIIQYGMTPYHFISQCIPTLALAYRPEKEGQSCVRRMFRAEYGNRIGPGTNGEEAPCWNRLSYVDIGDDGLPLIQRNEEGEAILDEWGQEQPIRHDVCMFMRKLDYAALPLVALIDPHLLFLEDGRLLIVVPASGDGRRCVWAIILNNPLTGSSGTWNFGPWCPIGEGFSGQPRYIRGEIYTTCSNNLSVDPEDDIPGVHRCELYKLHLGTGGVVRPESIGIVPPQPNRLESSFQEASIAPFGTNGILATFRTTERQHMTKSFDGGRTWTTPVPIPGVFSSSSRCDVVQSPSGRVIWAHNNINTARRLPSLSITETVIDPTDPWVTTTLLDPRVGVSQSYLNVEFGRDRDGRYNDVVYTTFDRNRGQVIDPMTDDWANWLVLCVTRESEMVNGITNVKLYQEGLRT